jgi:hypothetical protein
MFHRDDYAPGPESRPIPPITLARVSIQHCPCGCGGSEKKWREHQIRYASPKIDDEVK